MAVFTFVNKQQAADFAAPYIGGTIDTITGIAQGVENTNYIITHSGKRYILTLFEGRTAEHNIDYVFALMEHLHGHGFCCPKPLRNLETYEFIGTLAQRKAGIVSFVEGQQLNHVNSSHAHAFGGTVAKMHNASRDFMIHRENIVNMTQWEPLLEKGLERADHSWQQHASLLKEMMAYITQHWPSSPPFNTPHKAKKGNNSGHMRWQTIHADLFIDNVHFHDNLPCGIIDHYFSCTDYITYELAVVINAWAFETHDMPWESHDIPHINDYHKIITSNPSIAQSFLKGYTAHQQLTWQEEHSLPLMCLGAAMRFFVTRLYDWYEPKRDAVIARKHPAPFFARLLHFYSGIQTPHHHESSYYVLSGLRK